MMSFRRLTFLLSLVGCALLATSGGAAEPAAPSFATAGKTFLAKHCVKCHGREMPQADLALHGLVDEAAVLKFRKRMETVLAMVEAGEMPPPKEPRPTVDEVTGFLQSIRNVYEKADSTGAIDPGQVTLRRLNRTEYNRTVRDLLLTDFDPAEDFPADDVGYGFDNIGDVLSVSPLLMERYLSAAETISKRVILTETPKPSKRALAGRFLQPGGTWKLPGRYRPIDAAETDPALSGPLAAAGDYLKFGPDAELLFRATLYAETQGTSPVKVVLFLSGKDLAQPTRDEKVNRLAGAGLAQMKPLKILGTFEITARDAKKPQTIEVRVNRADKVNRAGIALVKPPEGEPLAKLFVENLATEGPLDARPASHRMIIPDDESTPQAQQTREIMKRLASRAYRRPATPAEVEALARFVDLTVAEGGKWEAGLQVAIQAMLCSPKFLFRFELDQSSGSVNPQSRQSRPLDEYQLASRLSYFIWSSMPDDELFALAAQGQLTKNLDAQARRMLKDPKATALVDNFAMQWLQLGKLQTITPDPVVFPNYNEILRQSMITETKLFLQEIVREDRSVLDMLRADYTYLNEPLARLYGITDTNGNHYGSKSKQKGQPFRGQAFQRVPLTESDRGGLLTQASVLTVTSNPTRTSPVKRGRWILEQILGTPPPPPPPNVPELEAVAGKSGGSLRQRLEQHRANPACANCHARMDPIGFALEHYNAIGARRDKDGEFPIDSSGTLPDGRNIHGAKDLKQVLLDKKELFVRSLAEKMLVYGLGRGLEYYDKRAVDRIVRGVAQDDYKFARFVSEIVQSDPFRLRRASIGETP